jgi:hypothetical protein
VCSRLQERLRYGHENKRIVNRGRSDTDGEWGRAQDGARKALGAGAALGDRAIQIAFVPDVPAAIAAGPSPRARAISFEAVWRSERSKREAIFADSSNMAVCSTPALPTDATRPGGVLAAGQTYIFDLLFDDRIVVDNTEQFYDTHTGGTFYTAGGEVPEPSTWAMMAIGFAGLGAIGWRGSRQIAWHAA